MRMRQVLAIVTLALLVALVGCSGTSTGGGTGTAKNTVVMKNITFEPSSLKVNSGDTVTFQNDDSVPHHIVVGNDDLGEQQPGESKTWKASADGMYTMRCIIHPTMQGEITVGSGGSKIGTAPAGGTGGY